MKLKHVCAVLCGFLLLATGRAAGAVHSHQKPVENGVQDEAEASYKRAMARLELAFSRGNSLSPSTYQSFGWSGRTAAINYVCSREQKSDCRKVIGMGLSDRALLVRDHALRVVLASAYYNADEKNKVAESVVRDIRNYRSREPLWIVERARKHLEGHGG